MKLMIFRCFDRVHIEVKDRKQPIKQRSPESKNGKSSNLYNYLKFYFSNIFHHIFNPMGFCFKIAGFRLPKVRLRLFQLYMCNSLLANFCQNCLMAYTHCMGLGPGQGQGMGMGCVQLKNNVSLSLCSVYSTQHNKKPRNLSFPCPCPCPVQCE